MRRQANFSASTARLEPGDESDGSETARSAQESLGAPAELEEHDKMTTNIAEHAATDQRLISKRTRRHVFAQHVDAQ